jgi:hypothetical protein
MSQSLQVCYFVWYLVQTMQNVDLGVHWQQLVTVSCLYTIDLRGFATLEEGRQVPYLACKSSGAAGMQSSS